MEKSGAIVVKFTGGLVDVRFLDSTVFRYLWQNVGPYLESSWADDDVQAGIAALRAESEEEQASGRVDFVRFPRDDGDEAARNAAVDAVRRKLQGSRRTPAVAALSGRVIHDAIARGALQPEVYGDVAPAFGGWRDRGVRVAVYDELPVEVQEAWLHRAVPGECDRFVRSFYRLDERDARNSAFFHRVAKEMGGNVLVATERPFEALTASHAGLQAVLLERQGVYSTAPHGLRVETSLLGL